MSYYDYLYGHTVDNFASVPLPCLRHTGVFSEGQHGLITAAMGSFAGTLPPAFRLGCFAPDREHTVHLSAS